MLVAQARAETWSFSPPTPASALRDFVLPRGLSSAVRRGPKAGITARSAKSIERLQSLACGAVREPDRGCIIDVGVVSGAAHPKVRQPEIRHFQQAERVHAENQATG